MSHSAYNSMEDLLFSRSFRDWVLDGTSLEKDFWENWIVRHPEKADMVNQARAVIHALRCNPAELSAAEIDREVRQVLSRLKDAPRYIPADIPDGRASRRSFPGGQWRSILAWLLLLGGVGAGVWFFYGLAEHGHRDALQTFLDSHGHDPVRERVVEAGQDRTIGLGGGSIVRLGKGSKLYYFIGPPGDSVSREVFLDGEALFATGRDAVRPFCVYTNQLVVKVLGTTFFVRSPASGPVASVRVRMGKVAVYRQEEPGMRPDGGGLILTPNQELVDDEGQNQWYRRLADQPVLLDAGTDSLPEAKGSATVTAAFKGSAAPRKGTAAQGSAATQGITVGEALARLERLYGIAILFDTASVGPCLLSAWPDSGSFYQRLAAVCKAAGASYEQIDGCIAVRGHGCGGRSSGGLKASGGLKR